jgi:hypothetical protein
MNALATVDLPGAAPTHGAPCSPADTSALLLRMRSHTLILQAYQDDGCGCSRDGPMLSTSPPAGVLPVGTRPVRARLPPGSGGSPVRRGLAQSIKTTSSGNPQRRRDTADSTHQLHPEERRGSRLRSWAACSSAHRLMSDRNQSLTRPFPRSNTGLGMSPYRCWYWSTVLR